MYCKQCHYDLRGQITPRCPECGTPFDVADSNSYLSKLPRWFDYFKRMFTWFSPLLLTLGFSGCVMLLPSLNAGGSYAFAHRLNTLRHIVEKWRERATSDPDLAAITPLQIKYAFDPGLSWFTQGNKLREKVMWQRWVKKEIALKTCMFFIYCALMAVVTRRRLRKLSIGGCLLTIAMLFFCFVSPAISNVVWRGDHSYLRDYTYITPVSWTVDSSGLGSVVAYESKPQPTMKRLVAFHYGGVHVFPNEEFQKLANAQGITVAGWE